MDEQDDNRPSVGIWFLRKLLTSPATFVGVVAGGLAGIAMLRTGSVSGGVGFGCMVGLASGMFTYALQRSVQMSYRHANLPGGARGLRIPQRLRNAGLEKESLLLERLLEDERTIRDRCSKTENIPNAERTVDLAAQIRSAALAGADELIELVRQREDPLLDPPPGIDDQIRQARTRLAEACRAVADAHRQIGLEIRRIQSDPLEVVSPEDQDLAALTKQLAEEVEVGRRVGDRLRGIVSDEVGEEPGAPPPEQQRESERD